MHLLFAIDVEKSNYRVVQTVFASVGLKIFFGCDLARCINGFWVEWRILADPFTAALSVHFRGGGKYYSFNTLINAGVKNIG